MPYHYRGRLEDHATITRYVACNVCKTAYHSITPIHGYRYCPDCGNVMENIPDYLKPVFDEITPEQISFEIPPEKEQKPTYFAGEKDW